MYELVEARVIDGFETAYDTSMRITRFVGLQINGKGENSDHLEINESNREKLKKF